MESPHEFDVEGFETVSRWLNKVDTRMNAIINDIRPMRFILRLKICIKSRLDAFKNRLPPDISLVKYVCTNPRC